MENSEDFERILERGIVFHKQRTESSDDGKKKKKGKKRYINGAHNSGSSKMKAEYRKRRAIKSAKKAERHAKK